MRAGCPQQRTHPRFPIGSLQGGAGRLPEAANAPKIPNGKASWRCGQAARSSKGTQDFQLAQQRPRPRFPIGRLQGGAGSVSAAANAPRFLIERLEGGPTAPKIPSWQLQGGAGRLPAAANAPKIPNWKASKRCCLQQRTHPRFPIGRLQGGAGRLPAAASAPKIPNSKASRRCGQAARSSECDRHSQLEGFKAVRAGQAALPAAADAPRFPGAGRLPAAAPAPKIPEWKASRRCGQAAGSSECTQDSQLEGFKAVAG